jgi:hypothetical protein
MSRPLASRAPSAPGSDAMDAFYDELAPFYHQIYPDWEPSIACQARVLDETIREEIHGTALRVLDVSCGIGT